MPAEKYKIAYIDDDPGELKEYTKKLKSNNKLEVEAISPEKKLDLNSIARENPALVIIDYLLEQAQRDGSTPEFMGSTFASIFREKLPEKPVVLLSKRSLLGTHLIQARDVGGAYDEMFFKDDFSKGIDIIISGLINLIEGFKLLKGKRKRNRRAIFDVLKASPAEEEDLLRANPPEALQKNEPWRVPEIAKWLRKVILNYPGLLYNSLYAATLLGIDQKSFLSKQVQDVFKNCRYTGVFSKEDYPLWWKARVLRVASKLMINQELTGNPTTKFRLAWKGKTCADLKPSKCISSGREHADCVCFVYNKPVMRQFSLPYSPDNRPSVMDEARISLKAIEETNKYEEELFTPDSRHLVKKIQKREIVF